MIYSRKKEATESRENNCTIEEPTVLIEQEKDMATCRGSIYVRESLSNRNLRRFESKKQKSKSLEGSKEEAVEN